MVLRAEDMFYLGTFQVALLINSKSKRSELRQNCLSSLARFLSELRLGPEKNLEADLFFLLCFQERDQKFRLYSFRCFHLHLRPRSREVCSRETPRPLHRRLLGLGFGLDLGQDHPLLLEARVPLGLEAWSGLGLSRFEKSGPGSGQNRFNLVRGQSEVCSMREQVWRTWRSARWIRAWPAGHLTVAAVHAADAARGIGRCWKRTVGPVASREAVRGGRRRVVWARVCGLKIGRACGRLL